MMWVALVYRERARISAGLGKKEVFTERAHISSVALFLSEVEFWKTFPFGRSP